MAGNRAHSYDKKASRLTWLLTVAKVSYIFIDLYILGIEWY